MDAARRQVREHGAACVLVTHSRAAAARADRVLHADADGIVGAAMSAADAARSAVLRRCCASCRGRSCATIRGATRAALLAVMLGVALAFSVHLINASALDEFGAAVRSVNGQPDLELRGPQGGFDEALFARVARASAGRAREPGARGRHLGLRRRRRAACRCAWSASMRWWSPPLAPALLPRPATGADRFALLEPDAVFLNAAARAAARRRRGDARCALQTAARPARAARRRQRRRRRRRRWR